VVAARQAPAPSQVRAFVCVDVPAGQVAPAHGVPAAKRWHAPLPSQTPLVPHDVAPMSLQIPAGSLRPAATFVQVPAVAADALHDLQVLLHSVAQQTPWRQKPDLHSIPSAQTVPGFLRPHDPFVHTAGEAHCVFVVQVVKQVALPQR
jgi:hypothetical protein